jgi:hypothetical protein
MDTELAIIFTDSTAEFTNLISASPVIDFPDSPLSPSQTQSLINDPNFVVTAPIGAAGYNEIQFMLANNFWGCNFDLGNAACGVQIRQGIAHMTDKRAFTKTDPNIAGLSTPIDNPLSTDSAGGLTSPNPCGYDASFPQSGPQCIVGALGGTSYHLANATGTNGLPWLTAPGSLDLNAAAQHFVNAGVATGFNSTTSILTGMSPAAASHSVNFFVRNDDPARLDLGKGLEAQICYLFTGSYNVPCAYLTETLGPVTSFPGFTTSTTSINLSWGIYTATYNSPTGLQPFDSSLFFTYNSRFASGISSIQSPNGPCSVQGAPTNSAPDYMYLCSPTYDSLTSQMEFAPSLAQSVSYGVQAEASFGAGVYTLPIFERSVQFGYPNTGWVRAINNEGAGLPNYFTWLNAWNPHPPVTGIIRQGFSQTTSSVSPFIQNTIWDTYIVGNIYDSLLRPNPLSSGQLIDWMVTNEQQLSNNQLTYTPPARTVVSFRFTLRSDLFFQDGRQVTSFDVAFSYLSQRSTFAGAGDVPLTGVTVLGPHQFDINYDGVGPFTLFSLSSLSILPGAYWTNAGTSAWDSGIITCTVSGVACYPAQYTLPDSGIPTVACALSCTNFPASLMDVNPAQTSAGYDPIANHTLVGSGPWQCGVVTRNGSGNCSSSGNQNPPVGGSYTLTRFGKGLAPASSVSSIYFRSSGNLALWVWSQDNGDVTHDFLNYSIVASCFGRPVTATGPCVHFQQGIGANGGPVRVGLSQVSIVNRFVGVNWVAPFNWVSNPPIGIGSIPPVLYEGSTTLNPASLVGCSLPYPTGGYDC